MEGMQGAWWDRHPDPELRKLCSGRRPPPGPCWHVGSPPALEPPLRLCSRTLACQGRWQGGLFCVFSSEQHGTRWLLEMTRIDRDMDYWERV